MLDIKSKMIALQQMLEQALALADEMDDKLLGAQIDTALQHVIEELRRW